MKKLKISYILDKFKNYHPTKWEALCFLLLPMLFGVICCTCFNHDIWFMMSLGRNIVQKGFPIYDPLSMHEGLKIVVQQWVPDVIYYFLYTKIGKAGIYTFTILENMLMIFVAYKLIMTITNNKRCAAVIGTTIMCSLFSMEFVVPRPHMITAIILLTELYLLENYIKTENNKYLYWLPVCSLLQINCHASMWMMQFCFILPFFLNMFEYKIFKLESKKKKKSTFILIVFIMFLVGIINPYGIEGMTYIFGSYGVSAINETVGEMYPLDLNTLFGLVSFSFMFFVYFYYFIISNKKIEPRHLFLLLGTTFLNIQAFRNLSLFIIGGMYPLAYYFGDKFNDVRESSSNMKYKVLFGVAAIVLVFIPYFLIIKNDLLLMNQPVSEGIDYLLEIEKPEDIILYCPYGECSYGEWFGIKPYIDSRAEIFLISKNKKVDIMNEYYSLQEGYIYYKDFLDKYNFNYILATEGDILFSYVLNDDDYELIYSGQSKRDSFKFGPADWDRPMYAIYKRKEK